MASFSSFLTNKKIPSYKTFRSLLRGPLTALRIAVIGIIIAIFGLIYVILIILNNKILITVPARGGNLTEGVIGAPHFINPILATTPTDTRLVSLVYSTISQEMQTYTVSPDGKTYTITLLPHLRFDDKKPLTSDDVAFTIEKLQDSTISTQSAYWQNISVDTPDATTAVFTLPAPDTSFLDHLNVGILPKHIWQNISDDAFTTAPQNLRPVGEGVFKLSSIAYQNGIPDTVTLTRNKYSITPILLKTLTIQPFASQSALVQALQNGTVDFSYSVTPNALRGITIPDTGIQPVATNQTVSIYRSSADNALANSATVLQLNQIIDKNAIIAIVQNGYGTPAGVSSEITPPKTASLSGFSLAVENDPSMLLAAQTIAQQLQQQGIMITVKAYDPGTFQNAITAGTFTLFLARNGDVNIPQQYSPVLPLYTESIPYIFNSHTHTIPPDVLTTPAAEYDTIGQWYTHINTLWKWFVRRN